MSFSFDFDEWSERLYKLIDKIEEAQQEGRSSVSYVQGMNLLMDELMHQENESVWFLIQVKDKVKDLVDGKLDTDEYDQFLGKLRIESLH